MYTVVLMAALSGSSQTPSCHGFHGSPLNHAVASVKNGKVTVQTYFAHVVPETRQRSVTVKDKDGKPREETQTYTEYRTVTNEHVQVFDADKISAVDVQGKPVSLSGRLAQPTRVLTAHDAKAVDSAWRSVLKPNVIVLVMPMPQPVLAMPPQPGEKVAPPKQPDAPKHSFTPPTGPQPNVGSASLDNRGNIVIQQSGGNVHTMTGLYKRTADGKVEDVPVKMEINYYHMSQTTVAARAVKVLEAPGKEVPQAALNGRLRGSPKVLVLPMGDRVDPYYLEMFRSDVLILVPPTMGYGAVLPGEASYAMPST